jgi:hypothetical protein
MFETAVSSGGYVELLYAKQWNKCGGNLQWSFSRRHWASGEWSVFCSSHSSDQNDQFHAFLVDAKATIQRRRDHPYLHWSSAADFGPARWFETGMNPTENLTDLLSHPTTCIPVQSRLGLALAVPIAASYASTAPPLSDRHC